MNTLLDFDRIDGLLKTGAMPSPAQPVPITPAVAPLPGIGAPMGSPMTGAVESAPPPSFEQFAGDAPVEIPRVSLPNMKPHDHVNILRESLKRVESSGNYQAKNKTTSASGAYQYVNGTWNNYGGYPEARLAPKHIQDARANEDLARSLKKFNGDPFRIIANHMLPVQANTPWRWTQPSQVKHRGRMITVPPVADYVRKVVRGTPYEAAFKQYLAQFSR